jgi:hypothetical protein
VSEDQPRVIYIRAGASGASEQIDLVGLISRIRREAIATSRNYFVLQLSYDQRVLITPQAWNTLKQVMIKQGLALVVSGGSNDARDMAHVAGFPLIGTAENEQMNLPDLARIRAQIVGYILPEELGGLNFEKVAEEYRNYEIDTALRTAGGFVDFVRQRYSKKL